MSASQFLDHLKHEAKNVLIVTHRDPDIDALGSCLAMQFQLNRLCIQNTIWTADHLADGDMVFLPGLSNITHSLKQIQRFDTLLVLDCSNLGRVKHSDKLDPFLEDLTVVNIDHHSDNSLFGDINIYEPISSVGELLCGLIETYNWPISKEVATCLFAAMSFDTGRFLHSNTTQLTLQRAAQMVSYGADPFMIGEAMFQNKSKASFDLMQVALNYLTTCPEKGYVYTVIPFGSPNGEIKVVDFIRQLGGYEIYIVFRERYKGEIRVNLRSKESFNVQEFSAQFGGGGHPCASGISLQGTMEEIQNKILTALNNAR